MAEERDVVAVIQEEHADFRRLFTELEAAPPNEREELFRHTVARLAAHEAAEEALVHKALRDDVPDGGRIAEQVLEEENSAEDLLARMEEMDVTSGEFLTALTELQRDVLTHAEHEEREEHPKLLAALDADRRAEMGKRFQTLLAAGPTHPHPKTPQNPGVRAAAGPVAGMFDRARDAVRKAMS